MIDTVQISTLGSNGRFGNQLLQYCFARTYAEKVKATLETPSWVGQSLFGISNPAISCVLPVLHESALSGNPDDWKPNVDLYGWFQLKKTLALMSRQDARRWFTFKNEWLSKFPKKFPRYAVCHLRQGDFPTDPGNYCIVSKLSYQAAVAKYMPKGMTLLWVEENRPEIVPGLPDNLKFLPDFFTLMQADVLFRSNSTFAWWAGVLGNHEAIYSPIVNPPSGYLHGRHDVRFAPGNDEQHAPFAGYGPLTFGRP